MYGYGGKLLKVNLSTKTFEIEKLEEDVARKFLGGACKLPLISYSETWMVAVGEGG